MAEQGSQLPEIKCQVSQVGPTSQNEMWGFRIGSMVEIWGLPPGFYRIPRSLCAEACTLQRICQSRCETISLDTVPGLI